MQGRDSGSPSERISIHRIAQIFRERNVDISTQHLMRAIRLFIKEGEGTPDKAVVQEKHQGSPAGGEEKRTSVTYQPSEQPSARVREEEFAKQLRLARYLAGATVGRPREIEKAVEKARSITKPKPRAKARSSGRGRSEKQRSGPSR